MVALNPTGIAFTIGTMNSQSNAHLRIQPAGKWQLLNLRELWQYRDLLSILTLRDIKLRYKQTALGVVWVILQPLIASIIFAIIFGLFANLPSGETNYLLLVYTGILPWRTFSSALERGGNSLISGSQLISKVYFPRLIIPTASALSVIVDFAVGLIFYFIIALILGQALTWQSIIVPLLLLYLMLIASGLSMLFSALGVYYRDFIFALPFVIQVWQYASPVVYSIDLIPESYQLLYAINPMVGIVEGFRWALLGSTNLTPSAFAVSITVGLLAFPLGILVFKRVEHSFADKI